MIAYNFYAARHLIRKFIRLYHLWADKGQADQPVETVSGGYRTECRWRVGRM